MKNERPFLGLYRAIVSRLWTEHRRVILAFPALLVLLLAALLAVTCFAPWLLTSTTLHALQASAGAGTAGPALDAAALARAFVEHQAPYLVALFSGMSAAAISSRVIGAESERGSLEILLATRHGIAAIGGAILLAAYTLASASWALLLALSFCVTRVFSVWFDLHASASWGDLGATVAMQLVLTLLAAELTTIGSLLLPGLARLRGGVSLDPMTLLASLPALGAFVVASFRPGLPVAVLSLAALAVGAVLLVGGAASIRLWFRPERFLES